MEYKYKLSILVPVYNVEKTIERCVNSLLNQNLDRNEYEVILVDDGSTDNSLSVIQEHYGFEQNLKVFSKPNGGLSSARNYALAHAEGKYIMHVDSDDFLESNVIGDLVGIAEKDNIDLLFFYGKKIPKNRLINVQKFNLFEIYTGEYILLNGMRVSSVWCNLYSHSFLKKVGIQFYDRISHQDVEYNYRLYPFAERVMFTDIVAYNYDVAGESISRTRNPKKIEKNYLDNLVVAHNIKEFAKSAEISEDLRDLLIKKMNSMMTSQIYSLVKAKSICDITFFRKYLSEASRLQLYPIVGKSESWKTMMLSKVLNIKPLLFLLFKKQRVK